jgi:hypothetical protein
MRFSQRRAWARSSASVLLIAAGALCAGDSSAPVPFPSAYRTWAVTKSYVVGAEAKNFATVGGFHHYYANEKAMEGFRTGQFPEGSVVVDERLEARQEAGSTLEGQKKYVAVIEKDATRYQSTGGWGFDVYQGEERTQGATATGRARCFSCHSQRKDHDFIFSEFRK